MICGRCGSSEANYHFTSIINGNKTQLHLCSTCAAQHGLANHSPFSFESALSKLMGENTGTGKRCPSCGASFGDLRRIGKAGCAGCYGEFMEELTPSIRNVQGSVLHVGKRPMGGEEDAGAAAQALKARLEEAVKLENYELAAQLRDEIAKLKTAKDDDKGGNADAGQ